MLLRKLVEAGGYHLARPAPRGVEVDDEERVRLRLVEL